MREIPREAVVEAVKALCIEANRMLPADLKEPAVRGLPGGGVAARAGGALRHRAQL